MTASGISAGAITLTDKAAQQRLTSRDAALTVANLHTTVTTDKDTAGGLTKAWSGSPRRKKVQAGAQITAVFGGATLQGTPKSKRPALCATR